MTPPPLLTFLYHFRGLLAASHDRCYLQKNNKIRLWRLRNRLEKTLRTIALMHSVDLVYHPQPEDQSGPISLTGLA